jgi:hypothetical protein
MKKKKTHKVEDNAVTFLNPGRKMWTAQNSTPCKNSFKMKVK